MVGLGGVLLWSVALCFYDVAFRRLPDWLTVPAGVVAIATAVILNPHALVGAIWPFLYLCVAWRAGGIGGGDIKLAVPLGIWVAWHTGVFGTIIAMALASAFTVCALLCARPLRGSSSGAHGPAMLLGAWTVVGVELLKTSGGAFSMG
ncbi:prepilin peptidase [Corynebacterium cystitidis]|uniref:Leader peptidase (Prepilin peptidase) / N-methyltransferase n=1 Tax=Corynebacterium cystitidis DSM 20524 TaxID=1121357 RepID=A0A1H9PEV5_9CORY|nr:A24 family peptidase [Corynebacterium cystitidis]WJY82521.1 Type IV leader peptidase family protein [Corynebacterium cystitidis DSM 20524]SER46677.1 leader peptidase (prepilin peptidase) / N-methyltransferase [Corynebacterium cystitidis DSM 20524]SNV74858.1 signal peptidase [Corynebacterium cystitidis]